VVNSEFVDILRHGGGTESPSNMPPTPKISNSVPCGETMSEIRQTVVTKLCPLKSICVKDDLRVILYIYVIH